MHFVIVAKDHPDSAARRLAARPAHMAGLRTLKREGRIVDGGAILNDEAGMIGSIVLCEFADRAALDGYLQEEAYACEGVWSDIAVYPLRRVDWDALLAPAQPLEERDGRN